MGTAVMTNSLEFSSVANKALRAAAGFWFVVAIIGQFVFAASVAIFYGNSAARGNWQGWNFGMSHGYAPGPTLSHLAVVAHLSGAVLIILLGALQLTPQVRNRFPVFHRWNGRVYLFGAFAITTSAMYMIWIRGSVGDFPQHLGSTGNALLVWIFGGLALRSAIARDFIAHRRWALRLFIALLGVWFYRVLMTLWLVAWGRPAGFDAGTFTGPFLNFMAFGAYLLPLGVLEMYLRAQKSPGTTQRIRMVRALFVVPLLPCARLRRECVGAAMAQYRSLHDQGFPGLYEKESQTNSLGYQFLHGGQTDAAVAVLQLNVEAHPNSANTYDSLGEAYLGAGNKTLAIENYRKALALDPKMNSSINALKKLATP